MLFPWIIILSLSALDFPRTLSKEIHYYRLEHFEDHVPAVTPIRKLDHLSVLQCATDCFGIPLCWVFVHNYNSFECKQYGFGDFNETSMMFENGSRPFLKDCAADGFTMLSDICWRISKEDELKNYENAALECGMYNAVLISLDATDKFLLVHNFLIDDGDDEPFIIGLNDIDSEGTWLWQNSKPADLSVFIPGQPNNLDHTNGYNAMNADCAVMSTQYTGLIDISCQQTYRFICEVIQYKK